MVEDEGGFGILAGQHDRVGKLVAVHPDVEAEPALGHRGEPLQEGLFGEQIGCVGPAGDTRIGAMGGHAADSVHQGTGLGVSVENVRHFGIRRFGVYDDGAQHRSAVLGERKAGDPPRLGDEVERSFGLPCGLDVHNGVDADRCTVGEVVGGKIGPQRVLRIADEITVGFRQQFQQQG